MLHRPVGRRALLRHPHIQTQIRTPQPIRLQTQIVQHPAERAPIQPGQALHQAGRFLNRDLPIRVHRLETVQVALGQAVLHPHAKIRHPPIHPVRLSGLHGDDNAQSHSIAAHRAKSRPQHPKTSQSVNYPHTEMIRCSRVARVFAKIDAIYRSLGGGFIDNRIISSFSIVGWRRRSPGNWLM